jgi:hypothetical protein
MNIDIIMENYETVFAEKNANREDVISAIVESDLNQKYILIQKTRGQINTREDLSKYKKELSSFLEEVYEIITAPGVKKFADWLESLSLSGLNSKTRTHIIRYLIDEYASYDDTIKNIIINSDVLLANGSLFEGIKKSIKDNINKRVEISFSSKDKVEDEMDEFVEQLDNMLSAIYEIDEFNYSDIKDFYTNNIEEKGDAEYVPDIDMDMDYHFNLVKKIVAKNDFLTTNKDKIHISSIADNVEAILDDIVSSIKLIPGLDVTSSSPDDIQTMYYLYEESIKFNNVNHVSEYLKESIDETWNKIIDGYHRLQNFKLENNKAKIEKLVTSKDKWKNYGFADEIDNYIGNLNSIVAEEVKDIIDKKDITKIRSHFTKIANKIDFVEGENPKESIVEYFSAIADDYEGAKVRILKKLDIEPDVIIKLQVDIDAIRDHIETISKTECLIDAINDEFLEGIVGSYLYIKEVFTKAIEGSPLKSDLEYLETIKENEYSIDVSDMKVNADKYVRLLENDLININLIKTYKI